MAIELVLCSQLSEIQMSHRNPCRTDRTRITVFCFLVQGCFSQPLAESMTQPGFSQSLEGKKEQGSTFSHCGFLLCDSPSLCLCQVVLSTLGNAKEEKG